VEEEVIVLQMELARTGGSGRWWRRIKFTRCCRKYTSNKSSSRKSWWKFMNPGKLTILVVAEVLQQQVLIHIQVLVVLVVLVQHTNFTGWNLDLHNLYDIMLVEVVE
jgi:hypothetical protein